MEKIVTVSQAVELLRECVPLLDIYDAIEYLEQKLSRHQLLSLYHHFFPEQFARSTASIYPSLDRLETSHFPYTEKEIEFLRLVDEKLFALFYLESVIEGELDDRKQIRIAPLGMGRLEEYEIGYDDIEPGMKVLLPLSFVGRQHLEDWEESFGEDCWLIWFETEFSSPLNINEIAHPHTINYKQLRRYCLQAGKPICFLPFTLRLLDFSTHNIWLDEEGGWSQGIEGTTLNWSVENINYLHREYRQANYLLDKVGSLIDWLEKDLDARFNYILQLWNQCSRSK